MSTGSGKYSFAIGSIYFLFIALCAPIRQSFEFNPDEGFNVAKATLFNSGYSLYSEIWSDQPPLFTLLLAACFKLFGPSIVCARLLSLLFAASLVGLIHHLVLRTSGVVGAACSVVLLLTSHYYFRLSASVMIGIPSIALALAAYAVLHRHRRTTGNGYILLSALLMSLSLLTKLFTCILIPAFVLELWSVSKQLRHPRREAFADIGLWTISTGILSCCFAWPWFNDVGPHLVQMHIGAATREAFADYNPHVHTLINMLLSDWQHLFLAFATLKWPPIVFNSKHIFPISWLFSSLVLLSFHRPYYFHHFMMLAVPLAWLGGSACSHALRLLRRRRKFSTRLRSKDDTRHVVIAFFITVLLCSAIVLGFPREIDRLNKEDFYEAEYAAALRYLGNQNDASRWLFTDKPIFAFYLAKLVPPEIAVISEKRLLSGNLSTIALLSILHRYQPHHVLIENASLSNDPAIAEYLKSRYVLHYSGTSVKIYSIAFLK